MSYSQAAGALALFVRRVALGALAAGLLACAGCAAPSLGAGSVFQVADESGRMMTLRIDRMEKDPNDVDGELQLYFVSIQTPEGWQNYCQPDFYGVSAAIPIQGSWDWGGAPKSSAAGTFTLACTNGGIGKCLRWGYKPWKELNGVSLKPYHDACVRMVRADYCGDGQGHTVTGTPIDVYDRLGIQKPEPNASATEEFEAGWSPQGATFVNSPRLSDDMDALVRECPNHLAGRTAPELHLTPAEVFERFPETLILNNHKRR